MSYPEAQKIIASGTTGVAIAENHRFEGLVSDIKGLTDIARKLRTQRFANGALSIGDLSLWFKLDETGLPTDCGLDGRVEACTVVEEVRANSPLALDNSLTII